MTTDTLPRDELDSILTEFETLHAREASVLREMKSAAIDGITLEKQALYARLREVAGRTRPEARHRKRLERLRQQAAFNQLLLVHARDAVRTILSQATGAPIEGLPGSKRCFAQEGVRLNVKV